MSTWQPVSSQTRSKVSTYIWPEHTSSKSSFCTVKVTFTHSAKTRFATLWKAKTGSEIVILLQGSYCAKNTDEKNNDLSKVIANRWTDEAGRMRTATWPPSRGEMSMRPVPAQHRNSHSPAEQVKTGCPTTPDTSDSWLLQGILGDRGGRDKGGERWQAGRKENKGVLFPNLWIYQLILVNKYFFLCAF